MEIAHIAYLLLNPFAWWRSDSVKLQEYTDMLAKLKIKVDGCRDTEGGALRKKEFNESYDAVIEIVNSIKARFPAMYGYWWTPRGGFNANAVEIFKTSFIYFILCCIFTTRDNWLVYILNVCAVVEICMRAYDMYYYHRIDSDVFQLVSHSASLDITVTKLGIVRLKE